MTRTHARLLAGCPLSLLLIAGLGCGSETTSGPMLPAGGAAAPSPGAMMNPSTETPNKPGSTPGDSSEKPPASDPGMTPTTPPGNKPSDEPVKPPANDPAKPPANPGTDPAKPEPSSGYPDLRGTCNIKSPFDGDGACIAAPPEGEGIQLHVGPSNYDDEAEVMPYIMQPGDESSLCWTFETPNAEKIYYQSSVLSGRAGTHHIINTMFDTGAAENGGFRACDGDPTKRLGSIPGASKAYMPRTVVAPEFADVGRSIAPKATIQSDMHYFNFTDKPILREYWLNVYYAPEGAVKREAVGIRGYGGVSWRGANAIAPGTDMVYKYECPIAGDGHVMNLLGHYHAHGKRFTVHIRRAAGGEPEKVFEMYDYLDPAIFEYNTVIKNPEFSESVAGAISGTLPVKDGDVLMWECHIINDSDVALTYTNEVNTGEMCNVWGTSVDIQPISCNRN